MMRLTDPSASDDTVTSSSAASVPTTSTARCTCSWRTVSTTTGLASSRPRACAVSDFEQPASARPAIAATAASRPGVKRDEDINSAIASTARGPSVTRGEDRIVVPI